MLSVLKGNQFIDSTINHDRSQDLIGEIQEYAGSGSPLKSNLSASTRQPILLKKIHFVHMININFLNLHANYATKKAKPRVHLLID